MNTRPEITINGVTLAGPIVPRQNELLTANALEFLAQLHRDFSPRVAELDPSSAQRPHREPAGPAARWQALVERNLAEPPSTFVYPRRLVRSEEFILCDGSPLSAGIVDFGLHIHRNARRLLSEGRAPFMSLLGMESEDELQLWQDLFVRSEQLLDLPDCSIRAIHMQAGEPVMDDDEDGQASSAAVLMIRTTSSHMQQTPTRGRVKAAA